MNVLFSPGSIITFIGSLLAVVGLLAYFTDATNLSVPTFFYGVPIFLIGLSLKTVELPPTKVLKSVVDPEELKRIRPEEFDKLIKDISRWRYGQSSHLEPSLKVLRLWNIDQPPKLIEIEENKNDLGYLIRMKFTLGKTTLDMWEKQEERLGRFFTKGYTAEINPISPESIEVIISKVESEN